MITVSIFVGGHNGNLTILKDEKLLTIIQEDRISRIKNDSELPLLFLEKVCQYTKIIDNLIINYETTLSVRNLIINYFKKSQIKIKNVIIPESSFHHKSHASSGFYGSGFNNATCISIDAWGGSEKIPPFYNKEGYYTTTIFSKTNFNSEFKLEYSNLFHPPSLETAPEYFPSLKNKDVNHSFDIGMMYDAITLYLGFNFLEAGKTMGLSSYGSPNNQIPPLFYQDTILGNMNLFKNDRSLDINNNPILKNKSDFKIKKDIAYAIQKALEKVFIYRIKQSLKISPSKNIIFSGGTALNVVGNYVAKKTFPDINFYFDPLGNDSGQSYGAAKYYYYKITNSQKQEPLKHLYHGLRYSKENLLNSIKKYV